MHSILHLRMPKISMSRRNAIVNCSPHGNSLGISFSPSPMIPRSSILAVPCLNRWRLLMMFFKHGGLREKRVTRNYTRHQKESRRSGPRGILQSPSYDRRHLASNCGTAAIAASVGSVSRTIRPILVATDAVQPSTSPHFLCFSLALLGSLFLFPFSSLSTQGLVEARVFFEHAGGAA